MECGDCTLCCKLLYIKSLSKPIGVLCSFCKGGCSIHGSHPPECKEYQCAYSQMENVSEDLRPDKCHVIFERLTEDVFTGLIDEGHNITDAVKGQIINFNRQGFSVSLSLFGNPVPMIFPKLGKTAQDVFIEVKHFLNK